VLFLKATSSIVGANDDIEIPPGAQKVDWEVELGIVIGKAARLDRTVTTSSLPANIDNGDVPF